MEQALGRGSHLVMVIQAGFACKKDKHKMYSKMENVLVKACINRADEAQPSSERQRLLLVQPPTNGEFTMCYAMNPKVDVTASYMRGSQYFRRDGSVGSDLSQFEVKIKCNLTSYISVVKKVSMNVHFVVDNGIFQNFEDRISSDQSTIASDVIPISQLAEPANNENVILESFSANLKKGGNFHTYVRDNSYIVVLVKIEGVDGKMMPSKRITGEDLLVYRYKILVETKRNLNGYEYKDYDNANAVLEKVTINTKKNALKLK